MTLRADRQDVRVLTLPYAIGNRALVIGVAQVMTARSLMLRDARWALGVGLPLVILVASFGGWWLAGLQGEKPGIGYHFEAYGYNLTFNRRPHLDQTAEYWWSGVTVLAPA